MMTKKLASLALALVMCLSLCIPVFATPRAEKDTGLVSVEIVSNEELMSMLPKEMADKLRDPAPGIMPFGTEKPEYAWDFLYEGKYNFSVTTSRDQVYSNYYFTGHLGTVSVHLEENSTSSSGSYKFKLYQKGLVDTTIRTYDFSRHATQDITVNDIDTNAKVFFGVDPWGNSIKIQNSYIA